MVKVLRRKLFVVLSGNRSLRSHIRDVCLFYVDMSVFRLSMCFVMDAFDRYNIVVVERNFDELEDPAVHQAENCQCSTH